MLRRITCYAVCHISAGLLGSARFTGSSRNYSTLLLEEAAGLLYVGGRGALYALNTSNISTPGHNAVSTKTLRVTNQQIIAAIHKETANLFSEVFYFHFPSVKWGQTNNSLKQIEQIPLCSSNFMDIGLNAPDIYSRVTEEESQLSDAARNWSVLSFFLLITHTHTHTCCLFSAHFSIYRSCYWSIYFLSLFIELTHLYCPPLFADWLGCIPWTEEAVSKQRQRQSGMSTALFLVFHLIFFCFFFLIHFFCYPENISCWVEKNHTPSLHICLKYPLVREVIWLTCYLQSCLF